MPKAVAKRFWQFVTKRGECWEWALCRDKAGYGRVRFQGRAHGAHRVAWFLMHGDWPVLIRHRCDNPLCVRPEHLEPGTEADNARDMVVRNRCVNPRGEAFSRSKLTEETVRQAREMRKNGTAYRELAAHFGVSQGTIYSAVTGASWWWLDGIGRGRGKHGVGNAPRAPKPAQRPRQRGGGYGRKPVGPPMIP